MTEIMASQPDAPEGYTLDPELVDIVKRLPGYLQLVVTLMATMVPSIEENKLQDKRGREVLDQGVSMVQVAVDCYPDNVLPSFFRVRWPWLERTKTVTGL